MIALWFCAIALFLQPRPALAQYPSTCPTLNWAYCQRVVFLSAGGCGADMLGMQACWGCVTCKAGASLMPGENEQVF